MNQRERHMPLQTMACFRFNAFEGVEGWGWGRGLVEIEIPYIIVYLFDIWQILL